MTLPSPRQEFTGDHTAADAALVAQSLRGDARAFESLVSRHYRAAYAAALALTSEPMDAEDVCQEAFIRALERLKDCRDPSRFGAWLLQIVRRRAHNRRESQALRAGTGIDEGVAIAASVRDADQPAQLERRELRTRLIAALGALNERQREVVLRHDLDDAPHAAIAESLGISEVMSRQLLFTARRALRALLGADLLKEYVHDR